MAFISEKSNKIHIALVDEYKNRLEHLEETEVTEKEEPFERSLLHNTMLLHNLWFEQIKFESKLKSSPLLDEILERRESDLGTFKNWLSKFAHAARPCGWAIWGWSNTLKTFVGFPIRGYDDATPLGVIPILVIDCWEHSYLYDYENFDTYLDQFWKMIDWQVIETRHQELAKMFGYGIK